MRSHLKVYFSFEEDAQALNDSEKARLLLAMLRYAIDGTESNLTGNERYLFPVFRAQIDRDIENYEIKVSNGSKGGRPKTNESQEEPKETENNLSETENNLNAKTEDRRKKIEDKRQKISDMFDRFWKAYPRKNSKPSAKRAFDKLNVDEELLATMLTAIEKQKQSSQWQENGGQFVPYPATWLNNKRWEDEVSESRQIRAVTAQEYTQRDYSDEDADAMRRMLEGVRA